MKPFPTTPSTKRDLHFYDKGAESQARIFNNMYSTNITSCSICGRIKCNGHDDINETVASIKKSMKCPSDEKVLKINWIVIIFAVMFSGFLLGVVLNPSYGNLIADICK